MRAPFPRARRIGAMSAGLRRKEQSRDVPAPPSASSPPPPPPSTTIIADPPPDVTPDPSHTAAAAAAMAAAAMAAAMATPAGGEGATPAVLKVRKPYTVTKPRQRARLGNALWTDEEHRKFKEALKQYGRAWQRIQEHIGTKTAKQIRNHADKWFAKLRREAAAGNGTNTEGETVDTIPPPRAHTTWTDEEHRKFKEAFKQYGRAWRRIAEHIGTKTAVQIRRHAEKWFAKLEREAAAGNGTNAEGETVDTIPPPRPKRKPLYPYPEMPEMPVLQPALVDVDLGAAGRRLVAHVADAFLAPTSKKCSTKVAFARGFFKYLVSREDIARASLPEDLIFELEEAMGVSYPLHAGWTWRLCEGRRNLPEHVPYPEPAPPPDPPNLVAWVCSRHRDDEGRPHETTNDMLHALVELESTSGIFLHPWVVIRKNQAAIGPHRSFQKVEHIVGMLDHHDSSIRLKFKSTKA